MSDLRETLIEAAARAASDAMWAWTLGDERPEWDQTEPHLQQAWREASAAALDAILYTLGANRDQWMRLAGETYRANPTAFSLAPGTMLEALRGDGGS